MEFTINKTEIELFLSNDYSWSGTAPLESNTTAYGCPNETTCTLYRND